MHTVFAAMTLTLVLATGPATRNEAAALCPTPEFVPRFDCPKDRIVMRPGGPARKGHGSAAEFCTAYPKFCRDQRPFGCRPNDECSWDCETRDACGHLGSLCSWKLADAPEGFVAGGLVGVLKPVSGEHVGRQIEVIGFAHAFFEMPAVSFALDGYLAPIRDFSSGFCMPAICEPPWGIWHPNCRKNSGFRAVIDLGGRVEPGQHQLQVFVYNQHGLPGVLEIPVVVDAASGKP